MNLDPNNKREMEWLELRMRRKSFLPILFLVSVVTIVIVISPEAPHTDPKVAFKIRQMFTDHAHYFVNAQNYAKNLSDEFNQTLPDTPSLINARTQANNFSFIEKDASNFHGTCSAKAWILGSNQKVISYSFYKSKPGYWNGLDTILKSIKIFYPGWQVRIYASAKDITFLENILADLDQIFFCDINNLPPPLYSVASQPVTMWRFAPIADPQVDIVMFRDTDSKIIQREIDAVNEWLMKTNKSLHIMRDHPDHATRIMGGLWGLRINKENRATLRSILKKMYFFGNKKDSTIDQPLLQAFVWPNFRNDYIAHDSYLCEWYTGSFPWPTQRKSGLFVGAAHFRTMDPKNVAVKKDCPMSCRPKEHPDWNFC